MPKSAGLSNGVRSKSKSKSNNKPKKKRRPRSRRSSKSSLNNGVKEQLLRVFSEEWEDYYGVRYIPSESDSKNLHFNVVPLVEDDADEFLVSWRETIRQAFETDIIWTDGDTDDAGRPTLNGVVNRYNDIQMIASGDEATRVFYMACAKYRQIWGVDSLAAYRSAAKVLHHRGHRLSDVDARLLGRLKRHYSDRELGLDLCPEEDRRRSTRTEIEAELDDNPDLKERLFRRSRGSDLPIRRRLVAEYQTQQRDLNASL